MQWLWNMSSCSLICFSSRMESMSSWSWQALWLPRWIGNDRSEAMELSRLGHNRQYSFCPSIWVVYPCLPATSLWESPGHKKHLWRGSEAPSQTPSWQPGPTCQPCECAILKIDPLAFHWAGSIDVVWSRHELSHWVLPKSLICGKIKIVSEQVIVWGW